MTDLAELLKEYGLDGWKVTETKTTSYELFFVHEKLETVRATDTLSAAVTVYVDHDGKLGDASFNLSNAYEAEEIREKIGQAAKRALLVFNEPYTLPEAGKSEETVETNLDAFEPKDLAARIARAAFSAPCPEGSSINALEVFLYVDVVRVRNSEGVDKTKTVRRVMVEAIPTFTDEKESVELYEDYRFTVFDEEKVRAEISRVLFEARDRRCAVRPKTPVTVNIVLRPLEIKELFWSLAEDLDYASVYMHANLHKIGDVLQKSEGCDKLTVTLRPATPGSERSASFDGDGTALTETTVIERGEVKNYFGTARFGQYLGVKKPSGDLCCMLASPGTLTEEELKKAPYIECASMSGMQVELYSDYIGGEIRLAYYYDGEKTVPVTGITMSARLSDVLNALRLSEKTTVDGSYEGPEKILLPGVEVL